MPDNPDPDGGDAEDALTFISTAKSIIDKLRQVVEVQNRSYRLTVQNA